MAKSRATLLAELHASVRSVGEGGPTTARSLTTFLTSFLDEVLAYAAAEPVGTIRLFAGATPPAGWLPCDGRLLPTATYAALYAALGTTYGSDGPGHFALPDLRGRVALGAGAAPGRPAHERGAVGGTATLTLTEAQLPPHRHLMQGGGTNAGSNPGDNYLSYSGNINLYSEELNPVPAHLAPDAITSTGAGEAIASLPPFLSLPYIIRVQADLPDAAPANELEFVFEAGYGDEMTRTMGARQATEYRTWQGQNVVAATYHLNGEPAALPLRVAAGDELRVGITRDALRQGAILTLQG